MKDNITIKAVVFKSDDELVVEFSDSSRCIFIQSHETLQQIYRNMIERMDRQRPLLSIDIFKRLKKV